MRSLTRREFAKTVALVGTTAALSQFRVLGANERVRLGFLGLGNRGDQVLDAFLKHKDAEVIAICDLYQPYLDFAAKKIGASPRQFKDYRRLLEVKDLDAVVIASIAHKTKSYLEWDARAEKFTNHPAANKLLRYDYRALCRL